MRRNAQGASMRRWITAGVAGLVLNGLSLTHGTTAAREPTPVTLVLDWTVNTNHTGLYVARAEGYFGEVGLEVAIESPPETGAVSLVLGGTAEFGISYQEEVTLARTAGQPITAIAAILQHNLSGFAARASAGLKRPRDMAELTYGGWGSPIEEAMVRSLVERDGGDPDAVEIVPVGSTDFFAATENRIDVMWIFEGWDAVAAELRDIEIDYIPLTRDPALDYYTPVIVATDETLQRDAETVRAFLAAVRRGYDFASDHPDKAATILLEAAPELDEALVRESQAFLAEHYRADAPRWGEMDGARWQRFGDWLADRDLLDGEFDPDAAFSNDYLPDP